MQSDLNNSHLKVDVEEVLIYRIFGTKEIFSNTNSL